MVRSIFCFFLAVTFSPALVAQSTEFERVLVPIAVSGEVPGAFGSRWVGRLAITNTSSERVGIYGYDPYPGGCGIATCPPVPTTPPGVTFFAGVSPGPTTQGAILKIERGRAAAVHFNLRIQDLSRQSQTWGTEIPIVRESRLADGPVELLDVPLADAFRSLLRVYDFGAVAGALVSVRFYRIHPEIESPVAIARPNGPADALLAEEVIALRVDRRGDDRAYDIGYAELPTFASRTEFAGVQRVRVEVQPITPGTRLWAFMSVTNNETQHVTLVTPQ